MIQQDKRRVRSDARLQELDIGFVVSYRVRILVSVLTKVVRYYHMVEAFVKFRWSFQSWTMCRSVCRPRESSPAFT